MCRCRGQCLFFPFFSFSGCRPQCNSCRVPLPLFTRCCRSFLFVILIFFYLTFTSLQRPARRACPLAPLPITCFFSYRDSDRPSPLGVDSVPDEPGSQSVSAHFHPPRSRTYLEAFNRPPPKLVAKGPLQDERPRRSGGQCLQQRLALEARLAASW